jgi:hypothetical protein
VERQVELQEGIVVVETKVVRTHVDIELDHRVNG